MWSFGVLTDDRMPWGSSGAGSLQISSPTIEFIFSAHRRSHAVRPELGSIRATYGFLLRTPNCAQSAKWEAGGLRICSRCGQFERSPTIKCHWPLQRVSGRQKACCTKCGVLTDDQMQLVPPGPPPGPPGRCQIETVRSNFELRSCLEMSDLECWQL